MSDKNRKTNLIDDVSIDELQEQIEEDKKQVKRSSVLMMSALIAIIALGIAWFVANNKVSGSSSNIAAESDIAYKLASVGSTRLDGSKLDLDQGTEEKKEEYFDTEYNETTRKLEAISDKERKEQAYKVGVSSLAWYMNGGETITPGARGALEFYVIPQHNGGSSVDISLELKAYKENKDTKKAEEITVNSTEKSVQDLVKGHILLFQKLDDENGYSGWCYNSATGENVITLKAPEGGFEAGVPYKVTVYWVWPKYFRNYIYNSRYVDGDLFEKNTSEDAKSVINFVQSEAGQKLLFATKDGTEAGFVQNVGNDMSDEVYNECNQYYNQADELFGGKTDFIYVNATIK